MPLTKLCDKCDPKVNIEKKRIMIHQVSMLFAQEIYYCLSDVFRHISPNIDLYLWAIL